MTSNNDLLNPPAPSFRDELRAVKEFAKAYMRYASPKTMAWGASSLAAAFMATVAAVKTVAALDALGMQIAESIPAGTATLQGALSQVFTTVASDPLAALTVAATVTAMVATGRLGESHWLSFRSDLTRQALQKHYNPA